MELTAGGKANREKYRSHIQAAELEFGLPEDLLMQLLGQESRFESSVIDLQRLSTKKAKGFGQFMLPTAQYAAQKLHITEDEMWKPLNQIRMSGFILKESIDRFKKDSSPEVAKNAVMWTYAEYNAGGGKIKRALEIARKGGDYLSALPKETQQYTESIRNWTGKALDEFEQYLHPTQSASRKLFDEFNLLAPNLTHLEKLEHRIPYMAKFLLTVGLKGKILKP